MAKQKKGGKSATKKKTDTKKSTTKGAGDVVKKLTKFLGITYLLGECSGCEERRKILNSKFPNLKAFYMTAEQKKVWERLKDDGIQEKKVSSSVNSSVAQLYNDVFDPTPKVTPITCGSCFAAFLKRCNQLDTVYYNETKE